VSSFLRSCRDKDSVVPVAFLNLAIPHLGSFAVELVVLEKADVHTSLLVHEATETIELSISELSFLELFFVMLATKAMKLTLGID